MSDLSPPPYDPTVHTDADETPALLELYCACGEVRRRVDPAVYLAAEVEAWRGNHDGPDHGPTTARKAFTERETRRKASFRAAGRQAEYQPKDHDLDAAGAGFDWAAAAVGQKG